MIVSGSNLDVKVCAMSVQVSWIEKYRCIPCIFYIYVTTEDVIEWYSPTDMISDGFQEPAKKLGVSGGIDRFLPLLFNCLETRACHG